jgi:hypothetical protein
MLAPVRKVKKCKSCRTEFTPARPLQVVCGLDCAIADAAKQVARNAAKEASFQRRVDREKREKMKSRRDWLAECQAVVNKYVRLRDRHLGCVSCDKPASWQGQWHASHLRSVGAASAVRFHLWNIHKACSICNNHKSGNLAEYEPRLREKIGAEKVEWLRSQNQLAAYSIEYLKRLKAVFSRKVRRLEKRMEGETQ